MATTSRFNEDSREAPDHAQEAPQDEVRRVYEEYFALSLSCFVKPWREFDGEEFQLELWVCLASLRLILSEMAGPDLNQKEIAFPRFLCSNNPSTLMKD